MSPDEDFATDLRQLSLDVVVIGFRAVWLVHKRGRETDTEMFNLVENKVIRDQKRWPMGLKQNRAFGGNGGAEIIGN